MANQINKIVDGLYITNYQSALDENAITSNNIKTIINCTKKNERVNLNVNYLQVPIDDPPSNEDIQFVNSNFVYVVKYINNSISNGKNVLVHCIMGSQRSATIIAIYLMVKYKMKPPEAINYMKSKRPICFFGGVNYKDSLAYVNNVCLNNNIEI